MSNWIIATDGTASLLVKGEHRIVIDAGDVLAVHGYHWGLHPAGYAYSSVNGRTILIHRLLMSPPEGFLVDHINHDKLDNRRVNLRVCTRSENGQNRMGAARHSRTGVRGVCVARANGGWVRYQAAISIDGKQRHWFFPFTTDGFDQACAFVAELRSRFYVA